MGTIAKFRCTERLETTLTSQYQPVEGDPAEQKQVTVKLLAAQTTDEDNVDWSKYTPSGQIEMQITNPEAFRQFEVGVDYTVEFRKAQPQKARTSGD
jgi:hypothetical protein